MKTILMKFSGPLQSWGTSSDFNTRRTDYYPSKSAVIGLISAALGLKRYEDDEVSKLNNISFAVRVDQQGSLLRDFQMVHKRGLRKKDNATYITNRYYLQDAVFIVALGSSDYELIDKVYEALRNPYYQLFLGRRSAPINADYLIGIFDNNPLHAIKELDWQASKSFKSTKKNSNVDLRIYADADLIEGGTTRLVRDNVKSFSQKFRQFEERAVKSTYVNKVSLTSSEHDAFSSIKE